EAAIGAVMLVSAEAWEATGGIRETSFMYAEDLDLFWSARKLGFAAWLESDAEFIHIGGASSVTRWSTLERGQQVGRAEAEMIRRHLSPWRAAAALNLMRLGLAARVLCFGAARRRDAAAGCRGYLRGY